MNGSHESCFLDDKSRGHAALEVAIVLTENENDSRSRFATMSISNQKIKVMEFVGFQMTKSSSQFGNTSYRLGMFLTTTTSRKNALTVIFSFLMRREILRRYRDVFNDLILKIVLAVGMDPESGPLGP